MKKLYYYPFGKVVHYKVAKRSNCSFELFREQRGKGLMKRRNGRLYPKKSKKIRRIMNVAYLMKRIGAMDDLPF